MPPLRLCVFSWLLLATLVHSIELVSQSQLVDVINGRSRVRHRATFLIDQDDAFTTQTFTIKDGDSERTIELSPTPPEYVYSQAVVGYIPESQYPAVTKVCVVEASGADSAGLSDNNFTFPGQGFGFENDIHSQGHQHERDLKLMANEIVNRPRAHSLKHMLQRLSEAAEEDPTGELGKALSDPLRPKPAGRSLLATGQQGTKVPQTTCSSNIKCNTPPAYTNTASAKIQAETQDVNDYDNNGGSNLDILRASLPTGLAFGGFLGSAALLGDAGFGAGGGALAVGLTIGFVCQEFDCFGQGSSTAALKKALRSIEVQIGNIDTELNAISQWSAKQVSWDRTVETRFAQVHDITTQLRTSIETNTNNIASLQSEISALNHTQASFIHTYDRDIQNISSEINADGAAIDALSNYTKRIAQVVQEHYQNLLGAVINLNRQIRNIDKELVQDRKKMPVRRALIDLFWKTLDQPTPKVATPFIDYAGIRPLSKAERVARSTLENAVNVVTVYLQRSIQSGASTFAEQIAISYRCDPLFMLNNVVNILTFQSMFDFIGPAGCLGSDKTQPWSCRCVVVIETDRCDISSGASSRFPWSWGEPFNLEPTSTDPNSRCTSVVTTSNIDNSNHVVHDSGIDIENFIRSLCADTSVLPAPTGTPFKYRIFANLWQQYSDMELSSAGDPDVCNSAWSDQMVGQQIHERLAYNIYLYWSLAYDLAEQTVIPEFEDTFYGKMPSGIDFSTKPFNSQQRRSQTYECTEMQYVQIGVEKLPLYYTTLAQVKQNFVMKVDGDTIHEDSRGVTQTTTSPLSSTSAGNVTVTSRVVLSDAFSVVLPSQFYRAGEWLPNDPDINVALKAYDIPFSQISDSGHPNGRIGAVNYIFESGAWPNVTATSPLTRAEWEAFYGTEFNPSFVGGNPASYARRLLQDSPTRYFCDQQYFEDGVTLGQATVNNDWCQLLRFYDVVKVGTTDAQLSMQPQQYQMEVTVDVPGGSFIQTEVTQCPLSVNVVRLPSTVEIELNSSAPELVTVFAEVHDETGGTNTACVEFASNVEYRDNFPARIGPITFDSSCGNLYVNVRTIGQTDEWCFTQPGIKLDVSHTVGSSTTGTAGAISHAVEQVKDDFVLDLIDQMIANSDYTLALQQADQDADLSGEEVSKSVERATEERTKAYQQIRNRNTGNDEQYNKAVAKLNNQSATVEKRIAENRARNQKTAKLIEELGQENNKGQDLLQQLYELQANITEDNNVTQAFQKVVDAAIDQYLASNGGDGEGKCPLDGIPLLGSMLCSVWRAFTGVIGGIIKIVLYLAVIAAAIYLVVECGIPLCTSAVKSTVSATKPSANSSQARMAMRRLTGVDDSESEDDEMGPSLELE